MMETGINSKLRVVSAADGACTVLKPLEAYLNYSHAEELKRALKDASADQLRAGCSKFVLDLSQVSVMDSCGLSVLISLKKVLEASQAHIALAAPSPMIQRLFVITKLDRVFPIFTDLDEAVESLSS